jgi:3-deoxy-D-manno-octulosonate 8-phosphate phosphatase (KDO 8-P phosphatase)
LSKILQTIKIDEIDAFIFDFDGVLTNNLVHLDKDGNEFVTCSRADGLGFNVLKILKKPTFIISTEKNAVVSARAAKLKVKVFQGVSDKTLTLKALIKKYDFSLNKVFYIGNDLNDYKIMQLCGYTACPSDSHKEIKKISSIILNSSGGNGVVRELLEDVMRVDFVETLYN